jgi:hypothetical protein
MAPRKSLTIPALSEPLYEYLDIVVENVGRHEG